MKLKDYRKQAGLSVDEARQKIGVSAVTWRAWERDAMHPKAKVPKSLNMIKLFIWSRGAVEPNDFHCLPDLAGSARNLDHSINKDARHVDPVLANQIDMFSGRTARSGVFTAPSSDRLISSQFGFPEHNFLYPSKSMKNVRSAANGA